MDPAPVTFPHSYDIHCHYVLDGYGIDQLSFLPSEQYKYCFCVSAAVPPTSGGSFFFVTGTTAYHYAAPHLTG